MVLPLTLATEKDGSHLASPQGPRGSHQVTDGKKHLGNEVCPGRTNAAVFLQLASNPGVGLQ